MKKPPIVEIRSLKAGKLHGFSAETNEMNRRREITALATRYHELLGPGKHLPLYVVSQNRAPEGNYSLFFGGNPKNEAMQAIDMPAGPYARMVIRPKYGLFWGKAIAEARDWFFREWLPASNYTKKDLEFEHHSEKTIEKRPTLELFFALEKKNIEKIG